MGGSCVLTNLRTVMNSTRQSIGILALTALAWFTAPRAAGAADQDGFVDALDVPTGQPASSGRGDYFVLDPGYELVYVTKDAKDPAKAPRLVVTVLPQAE